MVIVDFCDYIFLSYLLVVGCIFDVCDVFVFVVVVWFVDVSDLIVFYGIFFFLVFYVLFECSVFKSSK